MSSSLEGVPGPRLLADLHQLVRRGRAWEAELLAHLGEVDARRLYLDEGCSSMFHYCQRVLHFAEAVAYKRIGVARAARRHPLLLEALRRGDLHLTGASLLAPRLSTENRAELIKAATHRSAEEIRRLLADLEPKPSVATSVRRMPEPTSNAPRLPAQTPTLECSTRRQAAAAPTHAPPQTPAPRPRTEPLGGERYSVRFTADAEAYAQLQELRALMRHQIPDGDVGTILSRAVALLHAQVRKQKFGECARPGSAKPAPAQPTRHIPADIRRAVSARDGECCSYVSPSGRRCGAREFLEFHHHEPWARRPQHSIEGISLRCRAHNQHAARHDFAERHMARFSKHGAELEPGTREQTTVPADPLQLDPDPVGRVGRDGRPPRAGNARPSEDVPA